MYIYLIIAVVVLILFFILRKKTSTQDVRKSIQELEIESRSNPFKEQNPVDKGKKETKFMNTPGNSSATDIQYSSSSNRLKKFIDAVKTDSIETPRAILAALKDNDPSISKWAADTACERQFGEAVPELIKLLSRTEKSFTETRKSAAKALGTIGDTQSIKPLRKAYTSETDPSVKLVIGEALGKLLYVK
jgi:HEAT repeat protein